MQMLSSRLASVALIVFKTVFITSPDPVSPPSYLIGLQEYIFWPFPQIFIGIYSKGGFIKKKEGKKGETKEKEKIGKTWVGALKGEIILSLFPCI